MYCILWDSHYKPGSFSSLQGRKYPGITETFHYHLTEIARLYENVFQHWDYKTLHAWVCSK